MKNSYPIRIALIGKQRSGKDTTGDFIKDKYGFFTVNLAKPIYFLAEALFDMEEKDPELLIQIGEKLREIDVFVWCKHLMRQFSGIPYLLVTDVRMEHEVEYLKEQGFKLIKIHADDKVRQAREGYEPARDSSRTETEVDSLYYDYLITNNTNKPEDLYEQVEDIIEEILENEKEKGGN